MALGKKVKKKTKQLVDSKHMLTGITFASFLESTIVPVPLEAIMVPLMQARRDKLWLIALMATLGCVVGAIFGYALGYYLFDLLGQWVIVVILALVFWPSKEEEVVAPEPEVVQPDVEVPVEEVPDVFETKPAPPPLELEEPDEVPPMPEPVEPDPEPLDVSDPAIKSSLQEISTATDDSVNRMIVNEGLLQRFVVSVTNLANDEMAPNHQLLTPPEQTFRVYSQAGKQWIDAASYKRYTPYVNMLESFESEALLGMYDIYKGDIQDKYAEIGDSDKNFNEVVLDAIDQLLDTPEVPVPVEIIIRSVIAAEIL